MSWRSFSVPVDPSEKEFRGRIGCSGRLLDKAELDAAVAKWQPTTPLLAAEPGATEFRPVIELESYEDAASKSAKRIAWRSVVFSALLLVTYLVLWLARDDRGPFPKFVVVLSVVCTYLVGEYFLVASNRECLRDRARFFAWAHCNSKGDFFAWLAVAVALWLVQLFLQHGIGDRDGLLLRFGMPYSSVIAGDWWRVFTGPLFHANLAHWAVNAVLLVLLAAIMSSLSRTATTLSFFAGNTVGAVLSLALHILNGDDTVGYVGMSAGVLAVIGWGVGVSVRQGSVMPSRAWFTFLGFAAINVVGSWILYPNASNVAHAGGFLTGLILGGAVKWKIRS